jgi:phosphoserine phosphatase
MLLIDRLTFKSLKLALYELNDLTLVAEEAFTPRQETPGTAGGGNENSGANFQKYIQMSNSFREDLRLLYNMSKAQSPTQTDPDLKEYLEALRKAAKAQIVNVERE